MDVDVPQVHLDRPEENNEGVSGNVEKDKVLQEEKDREVEAEQKQDKQDEEAEVDDGGEEKEDEECNMDEDNEDEESDEGEDNDIEGDSNIENGDEDEDNDSAVDTGKLYLLTSQVNNYLLYCRSTNRSILGFHQLQRR